MQGHSHGHDIEAPPELSRRLNLALLPFGLATLIGLILLWPSADPLGATGAGPEGERFGGTVVDVAEQECVQSEGLNPSDRCATVTVRLDEGEDADEETTFDFRGGRGARQFEEGDGVWMIQNVDQEGATAYYFIDYQRAFPLLLLGVMFAVVVLALSRWRGLAALAGLAVSIFVLTRFILPAILEGRDPLMVSIVGASVIMFAALYMSHGFTATTTTAVLGTMAALAITGVLALIFVEVAKFTGLTSEEANVLQISADQINLNGLLLGGIIIGSLGVLDDVTVTQAAAVWEIRAANPLFGPRDLYRSALRIGRQHIASTVNTLVLAYAGASLPLLILFIQSERSVGTVITGEVIAEEIVRTLVGSIGLVAAVPITTALAAAVAGSSTSSENPDGEPSGSDDSAPSRPWRIPRAERAWRRDR